jgi:WD40 repeat protein
MKIGIALTSFAAIAAAVAFFTVTYLVQGTSTISITATTSWAPIATLKNITASVAFSPDGTLLASGTVDGQVLLADLSTGNIVGEAGGGAAPVNAVAFSADGSLLTRISSDGTVQVWYVSNPSSLWVSEAFFTPWPNNDSTGYHPSALGLGGTEFASASSTGEVFVGKTADAGQSGQVFKASSSAIECIQFSPDGQLLATADANGTVRIWNVSDVKHPKPYNRPLSTSGGPVKALAFSTSSNGLLLGAGSADGTVRLISVNSDQIAGEFKGSGSAVDALAFTANASVLAVGNKVGQVQLWNVQDSHHPRTGGRPLTAPGGVSSIAFSPDGRFLTTGTVENELRVWKAI